MARTIIENTLLLGKFHIITKYFWANNAGVSVGPIYPANQEIELLTKDEACAVPWMAYTVGQTLPDGAVIGGHLADGSLTYVAKITHDSEEAFGYYSPMNTLAYYEKTGIHTTMSMDILVLI